MLEQEISFWHWWILAAVFIVIELFAPGVLFLWLAIGAATTGILAFILPDMTWQIQFLAFGAFSVASGILGRQWVKRHPIKSDQPNLNRRGQYYVGRQITLVEPIVNGVGRARVDDSDWRVRGPDLPEGETVVVASVDGPTLIVERPKDETSP